MYFQYKNNMQMYLTDTNIVIKTLNNTYKIKKDEHIFEMIKEIVYFLKSPKSYTEIIDKFKKNEIEVRKVLTILIKTNVIIVNEKLESLKKINFLNYENINKIENNLNDFTLHVNGFGKNIIKKLQKNRVNTSVEKGDFLLIWNNESIEKINLKKNIKKYKKIILCGIEKGIYYIVNLEGDSTDLRKIKYIIKNSNNFEKLNYNQKKLFEIILLNNCMKFLYFEDVNSNLILIFSDLNIKNETINLNKNALENKKAINSIDLSDDNIGFDVPSFDNYVNNLYDIAYFGSSKIEQFPIPQQELWIINKNGNIKKKISSKSGKLQNAMLNVFLDYVNSTNKENDLFFINENKQYYYFNILTYQVFNNNFDGIKKIFEIEIYKIKVLIYVYKPLNLYLVRLICLNKELDLYICEALEYEKEIFYSLLNFKLDIEKAFEICKEINDVLNIKNSSKKIYDINSEIIRFLEEKNYIFYELYNEHSQKLREMGIYLGKIIIDRRN